MSLYHMMHGVTPATFFILPMLGRHPDEYPRFRDCFLHDEEHPEYDGYIHVYTRTGGGNREGYAAENDAMRAMPGFVADFDDSYDCTFASWIFRVPDRWKEDFEKFHSQGPSAMSAQYKAEVKRIFPKIAAKLDQAFLATAIK